MAKRSAVTQFIESVRGMRNLARPIPFASRYNQTGGLYGTGATDRNTMLQASGSTGTMFAIIQLLSTGAQAYGGWKMYRTDRDGRVRYARTDKGSDQRMEVLHHQALRLWNRPNPFMTGEHFREIGWQHMELVGEWYWVLNRGASGTGLPVEMWPVRPDRMEPVPDRDNFLAGWVYTGPNGEQVPLQVSEVIQIKYPDPADIYRGRSAVQALLADIDANRYTAQYTRNFFLNSAVPGGVVIFNKRLTDVEFNEFTARWREQHQGVARGHRVGVLEQGAEWVPNTYTMRDMQFVELRTITSDEMRRAYRIHQAMLGDSTDVNRANAQTAEEVHISWHEIPRLRREKTILNAFFLPMFSSTGTEVEFDYDDPSPTSANDANDELTAKSKAAAVLIEMGFEPEDVLEVVGLPAMRWSGVLQKTNGGVRGDRPAPKPTPALPAAKPIPVPSARLGHPELFDDMDITRNVATWIDEEYRKIKMEELERV